MLFTEKFDLRSTGVDTARTAVCAAAVVLGPSFPFRLSSRQFNRCLLASFHQKYNFFQSAFSLCILPEVSSASILISLSLSLSLCEYFNILLVYIGDCLSPFFFSTGIFFFCSAFWICKRLLAEVQSCAFWSGLSSVYLSSYAIALSFYSCANSSSSSLEDEEPGKLCVLVMSNSGEPLIPTPHGNARLPFT